MDFFKSIQARLSNGEGLCLTNPAAEFVPEEQKGGGCAEAAVDTAASFAVNIRGLGRGGAGFVRRKACGLGRRGTVRPLSPRGPRLNGAVAEGYAHCTFSGPAPISKWYFTMPRSTLE